MNNCDVVLIKTKRVGGNVIRIIIIIITVYLGVMWVGWMRVIIHSIYRLMVARRDTMAYLEEIEISIS